MRDRPPQRIDEIKSGFYRIRRVRNGPWVAAEITLQDEMIFISEDGAAAVHGVSANAYADLVVECVTEGEAFRHPIVRCAWFGVPIDADEYRHMLRVSAWAQANEPEHPLANPDQAIDLGKTPIKDIF